jgi:hypothetical protein
MRRHGKLLPTNSRRQVLQLLKVTIVIDVALKVLFRTLTERL